MNFRTFSKVNPPSPRNAKYTMKISGRHREEGHPEDVRPAESAALHEGRPHRFPLTPHDVHVDGTMESPTVLPAGCKAVECTFQSKSPGADDHLVMGRP
jgi:hypothetical protein